MIGKWQWGVAAQEASLPADYPHPHPNFYALAPPVASRPRNLSFVAFSVELQKGALGDKTEC